jgi:5-formyltetrahydrofolate cyclo-ligase
MANPEEIAAEKARLRREILEARAGTTETGRRRAAEEAHECLLALPEVASARRVFTCLSFGTELDTWILIDRLLAEGREIYVPRAERATGLLHLHRYPCALRTLSFGLRQPARGEPELPPQAIDETIDVALVLGVAFDRRGIRLGYGSGFFDRFLAGRPFPTVGLTFAAQLVERLPAAPHDVPMRLLVSEAGSYVPGGGVGAGGTGEGALEEGGGAESLRPSTTVEGFPPASDRR